MARPATLTTTDASGGATYSSPYQVNTYVTPVNLSVRVVVTGTVDYDLQYTLSDVASSFASAAWASDTGWTGKSATDLFKITFPITGLRIKQNSGSGSTSTTVVQSGIF